MPNDLYEIAGRVKNLIAMEDIAIAQNGLYLVNMYSHFLKALYDFSETLPENEQRSLQVIVASHEALPMKVMKLSKPKEDKESLYDYVMKLSPQFESNQDAYDHFKAEYEALGQKYDMSGDDFWMESEESDGHYTYKAEDYRRIRHLNRALSMLRYLTNKEKQGE